MLKLIVEPGMEKVWEQLIAENPAFSIAFDGYVDGPPNFSRKGPFLNLDHHKGVDRLATCSTAEQMLLCIQVGLAETFNVNGELTAYIHVNDPDQDVCLAYWLLKNYDWVKTISYNHPIQELVRFAGLLDRTGGMYPFDLRCRMRKQINWIFYEYTKARVQGELDDMTADQMHALIEKVGERITKFAKGRGGQLDSDTRYDLLYKGTGWVMFREIGADARHQACSDHNVLAYVMLRASSGKHYNYSVGRVSKFVPFPVSNIIDRCNAEEKIIEPTAEIPRVWGGSELVSASSRRFGSKLPPERVFAIAGEEVMKQNN